MAEDTEMTDIINKVESAELAMVRASNHLAAVSKEMANGLRSMEELLVSGAMYNLPPEDFNVVSTRLAKVLESLRHPIDGMQLAYDSVTRTISGAQTLSAERMSDAS